MTEPTPAELDEWIRKGVRLCEPGDRWARRLFGAEAFDAVHGAPPADPDATNPDAIDPDAYMRRLAQQRTHTPEYRQLGHHPRKDTNRDR